VELSFKLYPCGRGNHAVLDAALELYRRLDLAAADAGADGAEVVFGSPAKPLSDVQLQAKFRDCAAMLCGPFSGNG